MAADGDPADDDDAALEGERYQGVRDLFRQAREGGFDEDPPARLDALLMAAAREHAAKKVGTFERIRRWLFATMMQPAVAGAVAIAVIGGTAGVLYMKGKGAAVEPRVSSTAPPAAEPQLPTGKDVATVDLPGADKEEASSGSDAELHAKLGQLDEVRQRESEKQTVDRVRPKGDGAKVAATGGGGGGGRGDGVGSGPGGGEAGGDQTRDYKPDGRDPAVVIATQDDRGSGGNVGIVGGVKTQIGTGTTTTTTESPPPDWTGAAQDESVVAKNVTSAPETESVRGDKKPPPSKRTQAENLLRQARTAAKSKDCNTVKVMAKRAKQLDAAYYRDTFSRDTALKDCL